MQSFRKPITHRHLVEKNLDKAKAKYKCSSKIKIAWGGGGGKKDSLDKKKQNSTELPEDFFPLYI